jgi:hypothetical protein
MIAHQIPDSFRPAAVAFLLDDLIEFFEQFLFKRNAGLFSNDNLKAVYLTVKS